jgi:protein phosphatase 1 regulatory subunit 21
VFFAAPAAGDDNYRRLLEEYQKVKTQNAILKKAVLQEQQKSQQLEIQSKDRDVRLRASLEENDTLSFNNQRLTKRVEVLQASIEEEKTKAASGGWFGGAAKQELQKTKESMAILQEELDTKIKETEQLHIRMFEERRDHKQLVDTLADKLEKIKVQLSKKADEYEDLSSEHKHSVSKLTAEKSELISRVEDLSETLQRTKSLMQQREHSMTQLQQKLTSELESVQGLVAQKIPFDDSKVGRLNSYNVPTFDRPVQQKRDALVLNLTGPTCRKIAEIYREMLDAEREKALLQNANRTLELPEPIRHCNRKLIAALAESAQIASTAVDALQSNPVVLETILQKFGTSFTKLKSYRLLKLQLETQHQQKLADNKTIQETLQQNEERLHLTFSKLISYFSIYWRTVYSSSSNDPQAPSKSNAVTILRKILTLITRLREVLRDRSSALSSRVSFESQLDPFLPPEIKLLNEKILVSLSSLLALLDKTSAVMDQWLGLLSAPPRYPVRGVRSSVGSPSSLLPTSQESRTQTYMKVLGAALELSARAIPYADQLAQADRLSQIKTELGDRDNRIRDLAAQISSLEFDKSKLANELSQMKDQLASKQGSLTELLGELADTRQKLSQTSTLHQRQVTRVRDLERERDSLLLRAAQTIETSIPPTEHHTAPTHSQTPAASGPSLLSFDEPAAQTVSAAPPVEQSDDLLSWGSPTANPDAAASTSPVDGTVDLLGGDVLSGSLLDDRKDFSTPSIQTAPEPPTSNIGDQKWRMVVMDEAGKQTSSLGFSLEDKEREQQVKRFYEEKYVNMRAIVEATDRKSLDLLERTRGLESRLADAVRERDSLQAKMTEITTTLGRSKEELDTTRENYESQLKLMTEHLVSLNEKIGGYEEQLSTLHNCKVRCGKCSTWNTVHWLITEGKMGQRCSKGNHPSSFNYA